MFEHDSLRICFIAFSPTVSMIPAGTHGKRLNDGTDNILEKSEKSGEKEKHLAYKLSFYTLFQGDLLL